MEIFVLIVVQSVIKKHSFNTNIFSIYILYLNATFWRCVVEPLYFARIPSGESLPSLTCGLQYSSWIKLLCTAHQLSTSIFVLLPQANDFYTKSSSRISQQLFSFHAYICHNTNLCGTKNCKYKSSSYLKYLLCCRLIYYYLCFLSPPKFFLKIFTNSSMF